MKQQYLNTKTLDYGKRSVHRVERDFCFRSRVRDVEFDLDRREYINVTI